MNADDGDYQKLQGRGNYTGLYTELDNIAGTGNDTVTPSGPAYEKYNTENVSIQLYQLLCFLSGVDFQLIKVNESY